MNSTAKEPHVAKANINGQTGIRCFIRATCIMTLEYAKDVQRARKGRRRNRESNGCE